MSNNIIINNSSGNTFLENNNKETNIRNSFISSTNETYEFKEIEEKIEWAQYEQIVLHLKPDIERVWYFIQRLDVLLLVHNQGHYPLIFSKGNDTRKIGNQFHGNLFGNFPFVAKVNKIIDYPELKKIEWLFFIRNKYYMSLKIELLKVTEDNSISLIEKIKFEKQELRNELHRFYDNTKYQLYIQIEKILETEPINLVTYESGIINGKMEDIWDIVTDFAKLSAVAPNNLFPSEINLRKLIKGQRESFFFRHNNNLIEFCVEIICKEEKQGWNKWLIICDTYYKKIPESKVGSFIIQVTKINNNICQLTIIEKYFKAKNTEELREISKKLKYIIISLKDYFDNFFSHNNNNNIESKFE